MAVFRGLAFGSVYAQTTNTFTGASGEKVFFLRNPGQPGAQWQPAEEDKSYPLCPKTRQREVRGLCKASRELGCRDLVLLTENEEGQSSESWEGAVYPVRSMPIWKWLLAAESAASS